jgi:sulfate transport system ATP-binding protein
MTQIIASPYTKRSLPALDAEEEPVVRGEKLAVRIQNVSKSFGDTPALHDVSLDIEGGELVALLGPSGSGKTTLLRVLAGLETPTSGQVWFGETEALSLTVQQRNVGFVFQHYALFRHLRVIDNVGFGLSVRPRAQRPPRAEIKRRAAELLRLVQLEGMERRFPTQLSGGQRQRVALARALAIEPRLLLLDEPFGALDAKVRKDLRTWLRELHDQTGHTTVFVTHDQDEALELADRIVVMRNGRVEQVGRPDDIYDGPASPFVFDFIGDSSWFEVDTTYERPLLEDRPVSLPGELPIAPKVRVFVRPQDVIVGPVEEGAIPGLVRRVRRHGAIKRAEIAIGSGRFTVDADWTGADLPDPRRRVGISFRAMRAYAVS